MRRTSFTGANADTISDTGATTLFSTPPSLQAVFIDNESLPPGIAIPSCGHNSLPTTRTVS